MRILYWITTVLLCFSLTASGFMHLSLNPMMVEGMAEMGYPTYFMQIIGTWKVLAVVALLAPGFPRLKEWAYAGVFFLLTGAFVSHAVAQGPAAGIPNIVLILMLIASYALRPEGRRLAPGDT